MKSSKRYQIKLKSIRGLAIHQKKIRRERRIRRIRISVFERYSGARRRRKSKWRRVLGKSLSRQASKKIKFSSNIEHIHAIGEKLSLPQYKQRFSPSLFNKVSSNKYKPEQVFKIPEIFSLTEAPKESFDFIYSLFVVLRWPVSQSVVLDYSNCKQIDLDAQVVMDVVLKDFLDYFKKCHKYDYTIHTPTIHLRNYLDPSILKILCSIGTLKLFGLFNIKVPNIIPYELCIGNKRMKGSARDVSSQKEIHTTKLLDYVIECLSRMGRTLTPDARNDLCQVVGEILINAEEHATTDNRFSIGFFEETTDGGNHFGIFNLVIFNFGETIYEKFKDPECPTQHIVDRMKELSEQYTKKNFFTKAEFEEECLWTLYALQEGITTKDNYRKRGNGSIRFIESFFNLKGIGLLKDEVSRLSIHSGNTRIVFNGEYEVAEKVSGNNKFKVIAFNNSGSIEELPDKKFVTFVPNYFPGTMITAKIRIGEEDLQKEKANGSI